MPSVGEIHDTLDAARSLILTRLFTATDPAEIASLEKARDAIDDEVNALNDSMLVASTQAVAAAADALSSVLATARTDPTVAFSSQLQGLLAALDTHHDSLHADARLPKATATPAVGVPPAAPPTVAPAPAPAPPVPTTAPPAPVVPAGPLSKSIKFADLRNEYAALFASCVPTPARQALIAGTLQTLLRGKDRYLKIVNGTSMPWFFVGVLHGLEASFNFQRHLHNGDPLTARTTHVPAGRPVAGNPPFTFEDSAKDALAFDGLSSETDFSLPHMLYLFERFNGFGYRPIGIATPYLWSFSNHYTRGKFVDDGRFDANVVSDQVGAAVLLLALQASGVTLG